MVLLSLGFALWRLKPNLLSAFRGFSLFEQSLCVYVCNILKVLESVGNTRLLIRSFLTSHVALGHTPDLFMSVEISIIAQDWIVFSKILHEFLGMIFGLPLIMGITKEEFKVGI